MCADRIEIAQTHDGEIRLSRAQVAQDLLDHELGATVRIRGRSRRHVFGERQRHRCAVDGRRAREDKLVDAALLHGLQQRHRTRDVIVVVEKRFFDRFADGLEPRKVDHGVNLVIPERRNEFFLVANITFNEGRLRAGDCFNGVDHFGLAVGKIVV